MRNGRCGGVGVARIDASLHAGRGEDLDGRAPGGLGEGVGVPAEVERAIDTL